MSVSFGDKLLYFLAGAGLGGAIALLYAPQSGRETREELSRRAEEGRELLNRKVSESRSVVEDRGRKVTKEVTSLVDRGKEEIEELVEKGRDVVQKQKSQFAAAFEAGKEAYRQEKETAD